MVPATWIHNPTLQHNAAERVSYTEQLIGNTSIPRLSMDLDFAPEDRWTAIGSMPFYRKNAPAAVQYLANQVPKWLLPVIEDIAADIEPYFGSQFGAEMKGLASALQIKLGDIVAVNLIMQLESIGLNCSNWNNTGPTVKNDPGCIDVDPTQSWCYCKSAGASALDPVVSMQEYRQRTGRSKKDGPGMCTSVVAQDTNGNIFHGRNLDWNIPAAVRVLIADVDYKRGNRTVFTGTTAIGFVGVFNGVKRGGWSVSIDARAKGGKIAANILQMLLKQSKTPTQHMRAVLQNESIVDFEAAVTALSETPLIDENYYIVGGVKAGEGAVIARDRNKAADIWLMNVSDPEDGWFRLETNYDRLKPVPVADDRRTPGRANMKKLGRSGIGARGDGLYEQVMKVWPTFNHHTDYTAIMSANEKSYTYQSTVWYSPSEHIVGI